MIKADEQRVSFIRPAYTKTRRREVSGYSTGFAALDAVLPDAGWPPASITELHIEREGIGELRLLAPFLAQLSRRLSWTAWIAPPYIPYAPALAALGIDLGRQLLIRSANRKDLLWTLEQTLSSGVCSAVLAWPENIAYHHLRRLQLAAQTGHSCGFLFRPAPAIKQPSAAALRLHITQRQNRLSIDILKCRGAVLPHCLNVPVRLVPDYVVA